MEEVKEEIKEQPKKSKKKIIIILSILLGLALIGAVIFFVMFLMKPKYEVTVKDGGGIITKKVVVEDNILKELPEITPPQGKKLVTWVNDKMEAVRPNLELNGDMYIEPIFMDETEETVTLKYITGTDLKLNDIVIPKGSKAILPVAPTHDEWKFQYWIDSKGYIVTKTTIINEDTTIYASWLKPEKETLIIEFDTQTKEKIRAITINKGSTLIFPIPTEPNEDKVFRGWLDEDGNLMTNETKITKDMKLKANWKEPYTCPEGCTPNEGGATCIKESIETPSEKEVCPTGAFLYYGKCITRTGGESQNIRQCSMLGDEVMYEDWCMKVVNKVKEYTCPEGYEKDGDNCKKIEKLECTAN